jgi:hypothetical protein
MPAMAPLSGLNKAWVEAEAAPFTAGVSWGVASVEVDPHIASAEWCAWARPARDDADYRGDPPVEGRGDSAQSALTGLARNLREMAAN